MLTSSLLTELLCSLSIIGGLLLLGTFLRAKVKLFQKLFLPASVIGGFIGLLLGPMVLGDYAILRVPETYIHDWSLLPGTLIVPIFAAVPLGMFMDRSSKKSGSGKKTAPNVLKAFALFAALSFMQSAIGFGTNLFFSRSADSNLYRTFGYELSQGFCGGHGTAGAVGKILEGLGLDYWATAQGVAVTTATIGIIGGMLLGIIFINIAAAKGKTAVLKKPGDIPAEMSKGYVADPSRHASMGRETFMPSTVETISLHLAIGCLRRRLCSARSSEKDRDLRLLQHARVDLRHGDHVWCQPSHHQTQARLGHRYQGQEPNLRRHVRLCHHRRHCQPAR